MTIENRLNILGYPLIKETVNPGDSAELGIIPGRRTHPDELDKVLGEQTGGPLVRQLLAGHVQTDPTTGEAAIPEYSVSVRALTPDTVEVGVMSHGTEGLPTPRPVIARKTLTENEINSAKLKVVTPLDERILPNVTGKEFTRRIRETATIVWKKP